MSVGPPAGRQPGRQKHRRLLYTIASHAAAFTYAVLAAVAAALLLRESPAVY